MARKLGLTPHRAPSRPSPAGRRPLAHPLAVQQQRVNLGPSRRPSHNDHSVLARDAVAPPPALLSPSLSLFLSRRLFDVARPSRSSRSLLFPSSLSLHSIDRDRSSRPPSALPPSFRRRSRSPLRRPSGLLPSVSVFSLLRIVNKAVRGGGEEGPRRTRRGRTQTSGGGRKSLKGPGKSPEAIHGSAGGNSEDDRRTDRHTDADVETLRGQNNEEKRPTGQDVVRTKWTRR